MNTDDKLLYSIGEAAEILSISTSTLYTRIQRGEIVAVRLGGRRMIRRSDLEAYVAELAA